MSIEKLLEQHEAVVTDARKSAKLGAVTAAQLTRLTDVQAERAAGIKQRIASLEAARKTYNAQVDEAIAALREDLKGLEQRIATDRDALAPVLSVIGRERHGTITPAGKSTKEAKAPAKRSKKEKTDED